MRYLLLYDCTFNHVGQVAQLGDLSRDNASNNLKLALRSGYELLKSQLEADHLHRDQQSLAASSTDQTKRASLIVKLKDLMAPLSSPTVAQPTMLN